LNTNKILKN